MTALPPPILQVILILERESREVRMVLRGVGPCLIAKLLRAERREETESDWLLFGPTDPEVVETDAEATVVYLLAAE